MENEQNHISQLASPLMPWIEHICQPPFSSANFGDEAKLLMHAVLEAMQNGNSCIDAAEDQVALLHNLVRRGESDQHAIAPFIFQDQQLYLYRYWKMEQAIAAHVVRIKSQQLKAVQLNGYHRSLLADPQQQKALEMVASQGLSIITGGPGGISSNLKNSQHNTLLLR